MLKLKNIIKTYETGNVKQTALKGINIAFRENEFVSILGQSGSGKTTLLNIIGGLDCYTSGDLIINGVSTKNYTDGDWDYYRNHSIGFVFQSYNLIPHQTVLANVEMALTLAGVSKKEKKERAIAMLKKVGLEDHMYKKPNQMSGGQMQRVAIARALVNNPDILLADEPTGALDSETSVQIMELLKEISKDKLVIMVTHNPELAQKYSTRIVRLLDGNITADSNPYEVSDTVVKQQEKKKISMSFLTALSLSFNNLKTKKGRMLLTSFAGSIGIIGIALILALSTGMNAYISDVQKETMSSYPITISTQTVDVSSVMGVRAEVIGERKDGKKQSDTDRKDIYADYSILKTSEEMTNSIVENNLTAFKKYLDGNQEIQDYLGENGIVYSYDVNFDVFSYDADENLINSDSNPDDSPSVGMAGNGSTIVSRLSKGTQGEDSATNFSELTPSSDGNGVSSSVLDNYDVVYGNWPENKNDVVLVLDKNNSVSIESLYQLGFITKQQYEGVLEQIENEEAVTELQFSYEDACNHALYLVPACDRYEKNENGTFTKIEEGSVDEASLIDNALKLKISGVVRPKEDASNANITTSVAYTSDLTDYLINHTNESEVVKAQQENPDINVLTGSKFEGADDAAKAEEAKAYLSGLSISEKASFYKMMMYYGQNNSQMTGMEMDETTMAATLDRWLATDPDQALLLKVYEQYLSGSTYEGNMQAFGKVSYDAPSSISIYTDGFENKDAIVSCIEDYNQTVGEDEKITYTDYVALLTSSITTIINGITYVLIAFVTISLVVSCIMIGIITHISVMERTKEIGILRALGASKHNISQVFNAETFIIGCCSGVLGVLVSWIALFPINIVIAKVSGLSGLTAQLPLKYAFILILISIVITVLGGFVPAKKAARKDPVIALRTE